MQSVCPEPDRKKSTPSILAEEIDLAQLVAHSQSVSWDTPLGHLPEILKDLPSSYLPVARDGSICGLISREATALKMGGKYGFSLYARQPSGFHMEKCHHVVRRSDSVLAVLEEALGRTGRDFEADVILLGDDGRLIGVVPTFELAKLQSRLLSWQLQLSGSQRFQLEAERERLENFSDQLNRQNAELQIAKDAAMEASRHKSVFLSNMSHELRTPMNGVLGFLSLLSESELTEEQREHLAFARNSGESLLRIIDEILDFSRIDTGTLQIETSSVPLVRILKESCALFRTAARHKGLGFDVNIASDVPEMILGDPVRLRQVFVCLIGNAVKFTLKGRIDVVCAVECVEGGQQLIKLSVADTGIGMSDETARRIFSPFTQADSSTTRKYGGTGLGLSVASNLVELMGGTIGVQSVPGKGSRFEAAVPFVATPGSAESDTRVLASRLGLC